MGDKVRGYSKRCKLTFHVRGEGTESVLWDRAIDDIRDEVILTFRVNQLKPQKTYVFVGMLDKPSTDPKDQRRILDRTPNFTTTKQPVSRIHCIKIQVIFKSPGEAEKGQYVALFEKERMGWKYYGDPYAVELVSCHMGFQSQFVPGILIQICKESVKEMNITLPTVEICVTWDSVGGKGKHTFAGVRAICLEPIFKGRKYATKMKAYLASIKDDSCIGPDLVELVKRICEVRGIRFKCSQLSAIAMMISTVRIFFVSDRKAGQGFVGSPSNSYVPFLLCQP